MVRAGADIIIKVVFLTTKKVFICKLHYVMVYLITTHNKCCFVYVMCF